MIAFATSTAAERKRGPSWYRVFGAHVRAMRIVLRWELRLAVAALLLLGLSAAYDSMSAGERISFDLVEVAIPGVILGVLAPLGIWRGDDPARRAYFWAMPVDHTRQTLAKVLAGWVWVMALVAFLVVWALAVVAITGGAIGVSVVRHELLRQMPGTIIRDLTLHGFTWMWLVPFVGATMAYIAGSIIAVAANHPWRWYVGAVAVPALFEVLNDFSPDFARSGVRAVTGGRYGFETLVSGVTAVTTRTAALLPPGAETGPDFHAWTAAVALWGTVLGAILLVVARRHPE